MLYKLVVVRETLDLGWAILETKRFKILTLNETVRLPNDVIWKPRILLDH